MDPRRDDARDQFVSRWIQQPPLRSKLRELWNETGRSLQKAWIALWAAGLILLTLGIWGDSVKFWADKPYLTNLVSALTGAAFGIPLALVILQRVAAAETDAAEARAADRMAAKVSKYLAMAARTLVEDRVSAEDAVSRVLAEKTRLQSLRAAIWNDEQTYNSGETVRNSDLRFQSHIDLLENISNYASVLWNPQIAAVLAEVSAQWSILSTVCRPRLLETGGKWLNGAEERELNRLVRIVTDSGLEGMLQQGSALLDRFQRLQAENNMHLRLGRSRVVDAKQQFDEWLAKIITILDAMADLIAKLTYTERFLAQPRYVNSSIPNI